MAMNFNLPQGDYTSWADAFGEEEAGRMLSDFQDTARQQHPDRATNEDYFSFGAANQDKWNTNLTGRGAPAMDPAGAYWQGPGFWGEAPKTSQSFGSGLSEFAGNIWQTGIPQAFLGTAGLNAGFGGGGFPGLEEFASTSNVAELGGGGGVDWLGGNGSTGSSLVGGAGSGPGAFSGLEELLKKMGLGSGGPFSTALSAGSGIFGLLRAMQMGKLAQTASSPEKTIYDPFGGQRGQYQQMLQALMANPSSVTNLPGYKSGLDAVSRKAAASGFLGGGNMATALFDYGGKAYGDEFTRLSSLAGAGIGPTSNPSGANLLKGTEASNDLYSKSLASLGYAARGLENIYNKDK